MRELARILAAQKGLTESAAEAILDAALEGIIEELLREGKVKLADFGIIEVKLRRARRGRNPRTGDRITISASIYAKFKPGRRLKDSVGKLSEVPKSKS